MASLDSLGVKHTGNQRCLPPANCRCVIKTMCIGNIEILFCYFPLFYPVFSYFAFKNVNGKKTIND